MKSGNIFYLETIAYVSPLDCPNQLSMLWPTCPTYEIG